MKDVLEISMAVVGAIAIAVFFYTILAAPGLVSEQDSVVHAVALMQMAAR